ncbi:unnamed protein product [Meganyctiphanes norvegica]|uniref:C2H2-type domain-containing protein n=1 Tax=Meganyctiphanes norvegica TaxID=48144 RepID=A0AAV2QFA7_MEGNR
MADRTSLRIARVPGRYEGGADLESLDSESNLETDANLKITSQHTMDTNHFMITQPTIQSNAMDENPLICKYCSKSFKNKKTLQNHYKLIHSKNVNENMNRKIVKGIQYKRTSNIGHDSSAVCQFECNICKQKYSNESSIKRHIKNAHNDTTVHKCTICNKVFSRKEHVERHNKFIKCSNQNEISIGNEVNRDDKEKNETIPKKSVICEICQEVVPRRYLNIHKKKIHLIPHEVKKSIICPMKSCSDAFATVKELRIHLKKQDDAGGHNMEIEKIVKSFNNIQEFQDWKDSLELHENIRFVPKTIHSRKDGGYSKWYKCHRSGKYRFGGKGIRKTKTHGTCKIGSCCPAGMKIICSSDGTVKCIYNITHAGHGLNGPNNVYVPIHKKYKQFILAGQDFTLRLTHKGLVSSLLDTPIKIFNEL